MKKTNIERRIPIKLIFVFVCIFNCTCMVLYDGMVLNGIDLFCFLVLILFIYHIEGSVITMKFLVHKNY